MKGSVSHKKNKKKKREDNHNIFCVLFIDSLFLIVDGGGMRRCKVHTTHGNEEKMFLRFQS